MLVTGVRKSATFFSTIRDISRSLGSSLTFQSTLTYGGLMLVYHKGNQFRAGVIIFSSPKGRSNPSQPTEKDDRPVVEFEEENSNRVTKHYFRIILMSNSRIYVDTYMFFYTATRSMHSAKKSHAFMIAMRRDSAGEDSLLFKINQKPAWGYFRSQSFYHGPRVAGEKPSFIFQGSRS